MIVARRGLKLNGSRGEVSATGLRLARKSNHHRRRQRHHFICQMIQQCAHLPVAAIQVVQVVRCTKVHDPWGPTSEDQIAIFLKLISSVSHFASHSGYCREIVF